MMLIAHAILGAATSYATGNDIATGALSGATSEKATPILATYLFGTNDPEKLTQEQKDTIVSIISLGTAGIAYGATDGSVSDAVSASEVGKGSVENNGLNIGKTESEKMKQWKADNRKAISNGVVGFGDGVSGGATVIVRDSLDITGDIDTESTAYEVGSTVGENWDVRRGAVGNSVGAVAGRGKRGVKADPPKLSSSNPIHITSLRDAYEDIKSGKGVPNLDSNGVQKIYQGRENSNWKGATEWLVPNSEGRHHRILKMPDGKMGYVVDHDYNNIRPFPSPWYSDGGTSTKPVR